MWQRQLRQQQKQTVKETPLSGTVLQKKNIISKTATQQQLIQIVNGQSCKLERNI